MFKVDSQNLRYSQDAPSDSFIFFSWPAKFARPNTQLSTDQTTSYPQLLWTVQKRNTILCITCA